MNDLRKAAEMALEALEMTKVVFEAEGKDYGLSRVNSAAKALRQALDDKPPVKTYAGGKPNYCIPDVDETAKGEQEPFIYIREDTEMPFGGYEHCGQHEPGAFPVYTAPPKKEWVGLTDEEIKKIAKKHKWHDGNVEPHLMPVFRSLEAKLKEKNGG